MANNNGNFTLFLLSFFSALVPNYKIVQGTYMATTFYFYYILIAYGLIYFTDMYNMKKNIKHSRNDNETHYQGVLTGLILGMLLRRRLLMRGA